MSIDGMFNTAGVQSLNLALNEAALRQQAISSNIANVNTPGYQRVDVSPAFEQAFSNALTQLGEGGHPMSMPAATIQVAADQGPARSDGNTVQLEQEMVGLSQNSARYEFASEMLANSFHGMKTAITGQVN
jgi:flagellar basal-body rod protein FlgB